MLKKHGHEIFCLPWIIRRVSNRQLDWRGHFRRQLVWRLEHHPRHRRRAPRHLPRLQNQQKLLLKHKQTCADRQIYVYFLGGSGKLKRWFG